MATFGTETIRLHAQGMSLAKGTIIGPDGVTRQGYDVDCAKKRGSIQCGRTAMMRFGNIEPDAGRQPLAGAPPQDMMSA
jgi:hypothetical protein